MSLDHRADPGAQGEEAALATPTEDESALAPAASVRAPAKPGDSGLTTLVLWLVVLVVVVGLGLRLFAF